MQQTQSMFCWHFLRNKVPKRKYFFLTTLGACYFLDHVLFLFHGIKWAYINVHRYHFILFIIRIDEGEVEVWDSLRKDQDDYRSVRIMLKMITEPATTRKPRKSYCGGIGRIHIYAGRRWIRWIPLYRKIDSQCMY